MKTTQPATTTAKPRAGGRVERQHDNDRSEHELSIVEKGQGRRGDAGGGFGTLRAGGLLFSLLVVWLRPAQQEVQG